MKEASKQAFVVSYQRFRSKLSGQQARNHKIKSLEDYKKTLELVRVHVYVLLMLPITCSVH